LAQLLVEKEVIFAEDVEQIFGKRPWASRSEEIMNNEEDKTIASTENQEVPLLENKEA
jgi:cell division protease FtsH